MTELDEVIKEADKLIRELEKKDRENKSNLNFTVGIIYGLIIGWLCSFTATFVYEEFLPKLSQAFSDVVKVGSLAALGLVIWYVSLQFKRSSRDIDRTWRDIDKMKMQKRTLEDHKKRQPSS